MTGLTDVQLPLPTKAVVDTETNRVVLVADSPHYAVRLQDMSVLFLDAQGNLLGTGNVLLGFTKQGRSSFLDKAGNQHIFTHKSLSYELAYDATSGCRVAGSFCAGEICDDVKYSPYGWYSISVDSPSQTYRANQSSSAIDTSKIKALRFEFKVTYMSTDPGSPGKWFGKDYPQDFGRWCDKASLKEVDTSHDSVQAVSSQLVI